jgi:hypothetical protein
MKFSAALAGLVIAILVSELIYRDGVTIPGVIPEFCTVSVEPGIGFAGRNSLVRRAF